MEDILGKGGEDMKNKPIKTPRYGSYAHIYAKTHEDYVQLHALSDDNQRKLINGGFYKGKDDRSVTFDEAIEFFHNLKVSEAEISRMYRYDEDIEGKDE